MAKVRELFTVWGFEVDMKPLERLDQAIETTKSAITQIAVTAAAAGGAVFGLVKFTADAGDHAFKMAQKVGIGVEALQELAFAAKLSDVSAEELQQSLTILSRKTLDASRGSAEAMRGFGTLGIRIRDTNGKIKSGDMLLGDIADKFAKMPDGTKKTAMAVDLFGRSGANLIPLLNQGSKGIGALRKEAQELGIVFSGEQAKAAEEFNDNLTRLFAVFTGVRNVVGNELIPIFNDAAVALKELVLANKDVIATNVKAFAGVLIGLFKQLFYIMSQTVRIVRNLTEVFGGAANAAKILSFAISTFLGLKLAFGIGQGVVALMGIVKAFRAAGSAALLAQAEMLLIPLAITAIIAALALVAEDFITFSQGGNSVIGLIIKAIDQMFDHIAERSAGFATFLQTVLTVILAPIRVIVNAFGMIRDAIDTIFGNKTIGDFVGDTLGRLRNNVFGSAFGGGIAADFGLSAPPALPGASVPVPSQAQLQGRQINVAQQAEVKVDVTGLHPDTAKQVAQDSMTDAFENILRQTGREAESAIER